MKKLNPFKKVTVCKHVVYPKGIDGMDEQEYEVAKLKAICEYAQGGWEFSGHFRGGKGYYVTFEFKKEMNVVLAWFRKQRLYKEASIKDKERLKRSKPHFNRMLNICKKKQMC